MARRKKKKKNGFSMPQLPSFEVSLQPGTVRSIYAIGAAIVTLLFLLAPFNLAGNVGTFLFNNLKALFGTGYFLLPISSAFLAIGLARQNTETGVGAARLIGATLLFISGIGILSLISNELLGATEAAGGFIGTLIMTPFVSLFDAILGGLMLLGLAVVGTLLALDTPLTLPHIPFLSRDTAKEEDEDFDVEEFESDEEEYEEEPYEEDEEEEEEIEEEPEPEKPKRGLFGKKESLDEEAAAAGISFTHVDTEYTPPPVSLLERDKGKPGMGDVKANANLIKRTLSNFGIDVEMDEVSIGPSVTRFALKPAEGVRLQKILGLQNNLELALAASPIRIEAPIPGKSLVGIEVPNTKKAKVGLAGLMDDKKFTDDPRPLLGALGRDITGSPHFANVAKMPHVLIAGATGSGKSVSIHALITSLLYRNGPGALRLIMVDPKRVELTLYKDIPHLLTPVITDPKKAILALKWAAKEMDRRYDILESHAVRDITSYHENILAKWEGEDEDKPDQMPYIVIVIDELADIMQSYPRELEAAIVRLAQMSRAVGIHLVLSTQRPSVNVVTGLIKANVPARIALQVASQIDSRTILDSPGAETLLGAGDMLYLSGEMAKATRIQTAFISEDEVKKVVTFIKKNNESHLDEITLSNSSVESSNALFSGSLDDEEADDELFAEARRTVEEAGKASTSFLQRKLRVGYARAARLMDLLEDRGIVGPADGAKPRDVLTPEDDYAQDNDGEDEYEDEYENEDEDNENEQR
ncbi:MAG: DNA translocase FtsK 4TM domain-containing protein [Patescibacteria group bacterium UBA2163]